MFTLLVRDIKPTFFFILVKANVGVKYPFMKLLYHLKNYMVDFNKTAQE
jgi:hypothetical protein